MRNPKAVSRKAFQNRYHSCASFLTMLLLAAGGATSVRAQQPASAGTPSQAEQRTFKSPEAAAEALYQATRKNDEAELLAIFGPDGREIVIWNDDAKERQEQRTQFAQKYSRLHRLVKEPDKTVQLYIGPENWPLPIPIVQYNGVWYFDSELGKQEILYRRIGKNEMEALQVCRALADAEKEYYSAAHQYTAKLIATGNSPDGLYSAAGRTKNFIGPSLAQAGVSQGKTSGAKPFHGYYYRVISGANDANGFTVVAFPADYRSSGVMTFLLDKNGDAYEKDLGPNGASVVEQMSAVNRDNTWKKVD